jgi:hypothetical protein
LQKILSHTEAVAGLKEIDRLFGFKQLAFKIVVYLPTYQLAQRRRITFQVLPPVFGVFPNGKYHGIIDKACINKIGILQFRGYLRYVIAIAN